MAESKGRMILTAAILREAAGQVYSPGVEVILKLGVARLFVNAKARSKQLYPVHSRTRPLS